MDSATERPPSLSDLVRLFLVEQYPLLSTILTNKCETVRYHPVEGITATVMGELSIYVDGVHCGWLESNPDKLDFFPDGNWVETGLYLDHVEGQVEVLIPADPQFFTKLTFFVERNLHRHHSDRWSVAGIPHFLKEAHE